jgi:hypothetical protein
MLLYGIDLAFAYCAVERNSMKNGESEIGKIIEQSGID